MLKFLLLAAALVALTALLVRAIEPRMAFFPARGGSPTPASLGLAFEAVTLRTDDNEEIAAWLLPHDTARAMILYLHGNGGNLSVWLPILAGVRQQGYTVAAIDYRGYGRSSGRPSERGLYRDVDAAVKWVATLERHGAPLIVWGRSLGAAMAAYAATQTRVDGLILESAFPDARTLVREVFPLRVLASLTTYRFPTDRFGHAAGCPILVMHGDRDRVVPFQLGEQLFARLPEPKQFLRVEGADHNDLVPPDPERYWRAVADFIDRPQRQE